VAINGDNGNEKSPNNIKQVIYQCSNCNKIYKVYSGLWKHNKICKINNVNNVNNVVNNDDKLFEKLTSLIIDVVKQNQDIVKQNQELTYKITDICKYQNNTHNTITNSVINNNKTFNLNLFLNETCKDAMNLTDFIESLQIDYDDFEKLGEIGFVNGLSNIIIKSLKELDITQRPIHCTDKKREILYVKDENKWEKEDDKYLKIRKLIKKAAYKNTRMLYKFKEKYPDYNKSESPNSDRYDLLVIETMGGRGDNDLEKETKILKNIAKEVFIDKSL
jgi:hypothetical protein